MLITFRVQRVKDTQNGYPQGVTLPYLALKTGKGFWNCECKQGVENHYNQLLGC